jgi:hypothetical protein
MDYENGWEGWLAGVLFLVVGFMLVLAWSETRGRQWLRNIEEGGGKRWPAMVAVLLIPCWRIIEMITELYGPFSIQMITMLLVSFCLTVGLVWFIYGSDEGSAT